MSTRHTPRSSKASAPPSPRTRTRSTTAAPTTSSPRSAPTAWSTSRAWARTSATTRCARRTTKWKPRRPQRHLVVNTLVTDWNDDEAHRDQRRDLPPAGRRGLGDPGRRPLPRHPAPRRRHVALPPPRRRVRDLEARKVVFDQRDELIRLALASFWVAPVVLATEKSTKVVVPARTNSMVARVEDADLQHEVLSSGIGLPETVRRRSVDAVRVRRLL